MSNVPAIKEEDKIKNAINLVRQFESQIKLALPAHLSAARMTRILMTEVRKIPLLASCESASLYGAIIQCAQLGLEPGSGLGHIYLIPFYNNKAKRHEVQVITGYQGMIELCERTRLVTIDAHVVYEKDEFEFSYGTNKFLKHKPYFGKEKRGEIIGAYAVATYNDGRDKFRVLNIEEIEEAMLKSQSKGNYGPWKDHFAEMAQKTAIRRLYKLLPKSPEIARVQELEDKMEAKDSQGLGKLYEDFKGEHKLPEIEGMNSGEGEAPIDIEKKIILFSAKNPDHVKEVLDIMNKMNVASDSQQLILDDLEGKDMEELLPLIKKVIA